MPDIRLVTYDEFDEFRTKMEGYNPSGLGNLNDLPTEDKSSVVSAIKEIAGTVQELQEGLGECETISEQIVSGEV